MVEARARVYVAAYNQMGQDAIAIGDRDLALGIPFLKQLEKKAKFPFLNANIVDASTRELVFKESIIVEKAGHKVGVFGLLSNAYRMKSGQESTQGFKVLKPLDVARQVVKKLEAQGVKIIVLLGHLTLDECADLAKEIPGIDAILGSHSQKMKRYPDTVGNTYITDPYMKGKYLGVLTLFVDPKEADFVFGDPGRKKALESQVHELEVRIESRSRALESAKKSKAVGEPRDTAWLEKNLADTQVDYDKAKTSLAALGTEDETFKSFITFDYPPMGKTLEDDSKVLKSVEKLKKKFPELRKPSK